MKQVLKALHQRPIAVYPIYIDLTGSVTAGLMLSQLLYWLERVDREVWKTDAEIMQETRLTQTEFKNAKKVISGLKFMSVTKRGIPPKTFYSVDWDILAQEIDSLISSVTYKMDRRLPTSNRGGNLPNASSVTYGVIHRLHSENTTETTSIVEQSSTPILDADEIEDIEQQIYASKATQEKERKSVAAKKKESGEEQMAFVKTVVDYLNEKTKQIFKHTTKETIQFVLARQKVDAWTLEDFQLVIDFKFAEWHKDDKMKAYLTPSTLFRAANAEKYLLGAKAWKDAPKTQKPGIVPLFRQEDYKQIDRSKFKF